MFGALTKESHDPVHKLMPSSLTPKQLTLFSCPLKEPTLSPRRVSQTYICQCFEAMQNSLFTHLAFEVVITSEQETTRDGERY